MNKRRDWRDYWDPMTPTDGYVFIAGALVFVVSMVAVFVQAVT